MAYGFHAGISDADMSAVVAYRRSLDPVPFGNDRPDAPRAVPPGTSPSPSDGDAESGS